MPCFTKKRDNVAILTFNRPHRLNAINQDLLEVFIHLLQTVQKDSDVQSVILAGADRAFCAGEGLKETSSGKSFEQWTMEVDALQDVGGEENEKHEAGKS